jgi:glycosyltransferase EpsH
MSDPIVSVIVPVYNTEFDISHCVESLRSQTLADIELLFVDDCGTDGSFAAVEHYAQYDQRIRCIRNPTNMGPGAARNRGIEAARGAYLAFVDADDFVEPDFLQLLYAKTRDGRVDIVKGSCATLEPNADLREAVELGALNASIAKGIREGIPLYCLFASQHVTALYRRQMVMRSGARYGAKSNGEDTTFLLKACHAARTFELEPSARYYYLQNESSQVHSISERRLENQLVSLSEKVDYVAGNLPLDFPAYHVIATNLRRNLRTLARAQGNPQLAPIVPRYVDENRAQALRLPEPKLLSRQGYDMRALMEIGANICSTAPF